MPKMNFQNHDAVEDPKAGLKSSGLFENVIDRPRPEEYRQDLKNHASHIRWKTLESLDKYLIEFEANFTRQNGKLIWAQTPGDALAEIIKLTGGSTLISTDAIQDVCRNLSDDSGSTVFDDCSKVVKVCSELFAQKQDPDFLIHEAFFIVSDSGSVVLPSVPIKNHGKQKSRIVVAGIDRILPSLNMLGIFLTLKNSHHGQPLQIVFPAGSAANTEETLHVILVDGNRSSLLSNPKQRSLLKCIRCSACNYYAAKNINNLNPVKTLAAPYETNFEKYIQGSFLLPARSLNSISCPVNIDFEKIVFECRNEAVAKKVAPASEKWFYFLWKKAVLKRRLLHVTSVGSYAHSIRALFNKSRKGLRHVFPEAALSFNEAWRRKMKL